MEGVKKDGIRVPLFLLNLPFHISFGAFVPDLALSPFLSSEGHGVGSWHPRSPFWSQP